MIIQSDHNARGAVDALRLVIERDWRDVVAALDLEFMQLEDLDLSSRSSDTEIYIEFIEIDAVFVTNDKTTRDGLESLESVIRRFGRGDSAPAMTISDQVRVLRDADYQGECAFSLIDYLLRIDDLRGTGRLFLPFRLRIARE